MSYGNYSRSPSPNNYRMQDADQNKDVKPPIAAVMSDETIAAQFVTLNQWIQGGNNRPICQSTAPSNRLPRELKGQKFSSSQANLKYNSDSSIYSSSEDASSEFVPSSVNNGSKYRKTDLSPQSPKTTRKAGVSKVNYPPFDKNDSDFNLMENVRHQVEKEHNKKDEDYKENEDFFKYFTKKLHEALHEIHPERSGYNAYSSLYGAYNVAAKTNPKAIPKRTNNQKIYEYLQMIGFTNISTRFVTRVINKK